MGRPRKSTNIIDASVAIEDAPAVDSSENNRGNSELDTLKMQVEQLTKQLQMLLATKEVEKPTIQSKSDIDEDDDNIKISSDDYIKVMSLCPNDLNLATEPRGRGRIFTFHRFGEVKRILYSDLVHIMENHANFLEQGLFFIMNRAVIRRHGLDDTYSKIISKETMEKIILGENQSDAVNTFKATNPRQQNVIADLLIQKLVSGENIDLNLVDRLSRVIGYDIQKKAEEAKAYAEMK